MDQYLHLHWGLVALKQRQVGTALALAKPGLLSPSAWGLLRQARRQRLAGSNSPVPKIVVVE